MNVKKSPNQSTAHALATLLTNSLPLIVTSGMAKHLNKNVKIEPASKGKAVLFGWNMGEFKLTENLSVYEKDFTNTWLKSEEAAKVEAVLKTKNV